MRTKQNPFSFLQNIDQTKTNRANRYLLQGSQNIYKKNRFLSKDIKRLLSNALIQPHFHYAWAAWYPDSNKKQKKKLQVQYKFIHFCLQLGKRGHIGNEHFNKNNWLPVDHRFKQCLSTTVFKFFSEMCPQNMNKHLQNIE